MQSFISRARIHHRSVADPGPFPHRYGGNHVGSVPAHRRAAGTVRAL